VNKTIKVFHPTSEVEGTISLQGSKSIANRVLIIQALCKQPFSVSNLPECDDTLVMNESLQHQDRPLHHVKLAGTAGRFLSAYYATRKGTQIIDADEGLKNRPVLPLINVLKEIGCDIQSVNGDDRFPFIFGSFEKQISSEVFLNENITSQFVSALLMTAPDLPEGLTIHLPENQVSAPYIQMTIAVMSYFGVAVSQKDNVLTVLPQHYQGKDIFIEGDWSSASYYFGIAALSRKVRLILHGLSANSWQGDLSIVEVAPVFGLDVFFENNTLIIEKNPEIKEKRSFDFDFKSTPDLFQTLCITAAAGGKQAVFTGLQTLPYKETDRIKAIQETLAKCSVFLSAMPSKFSKKTGETVYFMDGDYQHPDENVVFDTFHDHRMAMSMAMLATKGVVHINDPSVVNKSYPSFWKDLQLIGFVVEESSH
jgi:3-phosphoshikimate 1-carboxyvinyltransferase